MTTHLQQLEATDPDTFRALEGEAIRQWHGVEMIPSENYAHPEVLAALGSIFTNKYSEGYPGRRYYGGQEFTDEIEELARARACSVFRAEHANVQPLSGSPMNQAAYLGLLEPGDTILAMDLSHGGHLTHGAPVSHMGRIFNFVRYKTAGEDGHIDFGEVRRLAQAHKPKLVLCGHSSYPRELDYAAFQEIADEIGALTMADVSHLGGLIAADVLANPLDAGFDVMTTTTHKSLRGPRGGLILCKKEHAKRIDSSVFPGLQGGPHMNQVAGTAVTLKLAAEPAFKVYAAQTLKNAGTLAKCFRDHQAQLVTGGTENHLLVLNTVEGFGIDGRVAERALDEVGITTNRQIVPDDPNPPLRPSGVRLGTPAASARGMKEPEMAALVEIMVRALRAHDDANLLSELRADTRMICDRFPVPGLGEGAAL